MYVNIYVKVCLFTVSRQVAQATTFFTMAPNMCGSAVWNSLYITVLAPRILRCLLDFRKICGAVVTAVYIYVCVCVCVYVCIGIFVFSVCV
jgi:hypothetical protein